MQTSIRRASALASLIIVGALLPMPAALAQQPPAAPQPGPVAAPKIAQTAPKGTARTAPAAKAEAATSDGASRVEAQLRQRIEQLEEQLADMQIMVGTLESMSRNGGGGTQRAPSASGGGNDQLEQQVRQLSTQVEQLAAQVRSLGGRSGQAQPVPGSFGTTTVTQDTRGDPIDRLLTAPAAAGGAPAVAALPTPRIGAEPVAAAPGDGNSKQAYEAAYGYLLQQDYGAAEAAFDEFLRRYPADPLAGNAQYWLGESFFVRGNYRSAAGAFLKGYQSYARSAKAPDSLLKLAMSLDRLGQKDQACASYGELGLKFPAAPPNVKTRADTERRRIGCS